MRRQQFETPEPVSLRISLPAGDVALEAAETTTTEVELEALRDSERARALVAETVIEKHGGEVVVLVPEGRRWFGWRDELALRIRAPRWSGVVVRTSSADVEGTGSFGAVDVESSSGDVDFGEAVDFNVRTASGDVRVREVRGTADINGVSGDVELAHVGGHASLAAVSGDITIRAADGSLTTSSVSGDQRIEAVREGQINLQSVSGDVFVAVRRGSQVWIDVSSMSGDVESELEVSDTPPDEEAGPLVELRVKTMSGDIQLARAPARTELPAA